MTLTYTSSAHNCSPSFRLKIEAVNHCRSYKLTFSPICGLKPLPFITTNKLTMDQFTKLGNNIVLNPSSSPYTFIYFQIVLTQLPKCSSDKASSLQPPTCSVWLKFLPLCFYFCCHQDDLLKPKGNVSAHKHSVKYQWPPRDKKKKHQKKTPSLS